LSHKQNNSSSRR